MLCRDLRPETVTVNDPASVWHGRRGEIVSRHDDAVWWRDDLTGTRVRFPLPTAT